MAAPSDPPAGPPADPSRPDGDRPRWTEPLSPREVDVLELIAQGRTNREIATSLYLSANTVKSHIRSAYQKIGVDSRTQAVIWCFRNGLGDWEGRSDQAG